MKVVKKASDCKVGDIVRSQPLQGDYQITARGEEGLVARRMINGQATGMMMASSVQQLQDALDLKVLEIWRPA